MLVPEPLCLVHQDTMHAGGRTEQTNSFGYFLSLTVGMVDLRKGRTLVKWTAKGLGVTPWSLSLHMDGHGNAAIKVHLTVSSGGSKLQAVPLNC